jgi:glucose-6-phosphate 1-dehydrogenase
MSNGTPPPDAVLIIFGAAGDLTWRKLVPSLFSLYVDKWLPEHFAVVGVDIKKMKTADFVARLRDGVEKFWGRGKIDAHMWADFSRHLSFIAGDFSSAQIYGTIGSVLSAKDKEWDTKANRLFYLAVPPMLIEPIVRELVQAHLAHERKRTRIVVEKPFGRDLASARALNRVLSAGFEEHQIYRIDHYLGKDTVQNILAFRFANTLFDPIWDRRYIDHVQISVTEDIGVEHRGPYYETAGALRDMIQNHLLQLLCLVAMEPPVSFEAEEIRNKKLDVLRAVRPLQKSEIHRVSARGQYGEGWMQGTHVRSYREETGVAPASTIETFAALKLYIDNWRWQDVPFYLRTGKRLTRKVSAISIQFRPVPHLSFPSTALGDWQPNRLIIHIQPNEGIVLRFQAKRPRLPMRLSTVDMRFFYHEAFNVNPPDAYETLLLDVMLGDQTLFKRIDMIEASWSIVAPVLDSWESVAPENFPNYSAGTWGPEEAEVLIAQDGRRWFKVRVNR